MALVLVTFVTLYTATVRILLLDSLVFVHECCALFLLGYFGDYSHRFFCILVWWFAVSVAVQLL
jgi:hypothetical protein